MMNEGLFSSKTDNWSTPQDFYEELDKEFHFTTDVCADKTNHKCDYYFSKENQMDGLKMAWAGRCWMNPPYGREIGKWVKKASEEVKRGVPLVVCLLPARTDTKYFHEYIYNKHEIRFIKGRLKFGGSKNSAPFPSMVVIMKNSNNAQSGKNEDNVLRIGVMGKIINSMVKRYQEDTIQGLMVVAKLNDGTFETAWTNMNYIEKIGLAECLKENIETFKDI